MIYSIFISNVTEHSRVAHVALTLKIARSINAPAITTAVETLTVIDVSLTRPPSSSKAVVACAYILIHPIHAVPVLPTDHSHAVIMAGYWLVAHTVGALTPDIATLAKPVLSTCYHSTYSEI